MLRPRGLSRCRSALSPHRKWCAADGAGLGCSDRPTCAGFLVRHRVGRRPPVVVAHRALPADEPLPNVSRTDGPRRIIPGAAGRTTSRTGESDGDQNHEAADQKDPGVVLDELHSWSSLVFSQARSVTLLRRDGRDPSKKTPLGN